MSLADRSDQIISLHQSVAAVAADLTAAMLLFVFVAAAAAIATTTIGAGCWNS